MRQEGDDIDSGVYTSMKCEINPCHHCWRVVWPPDALTRLLMEADGVAENALDALLKRVMLKRRTTSGGRCPRRKKITQSSGGSVVGGPAVRYTERIADKWTLESPV